MSESVKMVIDDPSKFGLLATKVKLDLIKGAVNTVNVMAALARREGIKNIQASFITRNTFTVRQIQFTPMPESKYVKISAIQSFVGATEKAPYMKRQEEGGKHSPVQGQTLAIPTDLARGGSRRRPVAANMRVGKLTRRKRVRSAGGNVARAYIAFKKGLLLPMGGTDGQRNLFVVTKFVKTRRGVAFKIRQVYNFDKSQTTTKPEPWLLPASEKIGRQCQAIFNSQMKKIEK